MGKYLKICRDSVKGGVWNSDWNGDLFLAFSKDYEHASFVVRCGKYFGDAFYCEVHVLGAGSNNSGRDSAAGH